MDREVSWQSHESRIGRNENRERPGGLMRQGFFMLLA
jgi:hypothetical protein